MNIRFGTKMPCTLLLFAIVLWGACMQTRAQGGAVVVFKKIKNIYYGQRPFALTDSLIIAPNRTFSFSLVNTQPGVATLTGNTLNPNGVGRGIIKLFVPSPDSLSPSITILDTFNILKANQIVYFDSISAKKVGITFTIVGSVYNPNTGFPSGLSVQFALENTPSSIATLNTATKQITTLGVGWVTVRATQNGNNFYNRADTVRQRFYISKGKQEIVFAAIPNRLVGSGSYSLSAIVNQPNSGLRLNLFLAVAPANVTLQNKTISIPATADTGLVMVVATVDGDSNYIGDTATQTFHVIPRNTSGVAELAPTATSLYPNPTRDVVNLMGLLPEPLEITIYNALGQVKERTTATPDAGIVKLNANDYPAGMYIVSGSQMGRSFKLKFLKE